MPRKPTSVYVILQQPGPIGMPGPGIITAEPRDPATIPLTAFRIPIRDGEEPKDAAERGYEAHPIGTVLTWVEDTKVTASAVGITLEDIDDPRLQPPGGEPPTPT